MKPSVHLTRPRRTTTPAIPEDQRAEMCRLSAALGQAQRGEWTEALLWQYTTDPDLRALFAACGISVPVEALP